MQYALHMTPIDDHRQYPAFNLERDPSWLVLRIMSEFVQGITFLSQLKKTVTFFGSARLKEDDPYYELARLLGKRCAEKGFTVVTGGGPGIMKAGNQGAVEGNGMSVGITIQLPFEEAANPFVRQSQSFNYFFSRKYMLDFSAQAYLFFPGGFGTLDELFTILTLIQTGKMETPIPPVILVGSDFWSGLLGWIQNNLRDTFKTISPHDVDIFHMVDDPDEIMRLVTEAEERAIW
jgi:uncharacterized protein (TIGR00730 family)